MKQIQPFWAEMGLVVQPTDTLTQIAQSYVLQDHAQRSWHVELLQKTLQRINDELGETTTQTICEWADSTCRMNIDESFNAMIWRAFFGRLAGLSSLSVPLMPLHLPEQHIEKIVAVTNHHRKRREHVMRQLDILSQSPRSDWDEYIYATYTEGCVPTTWVANQISFVDSISLWQDIITDLSPEEIELLVDWGKLQADMVGETVEKVRFKLDFGSQHLSRKDAGSC